MKQHFAMLLTSLMMLLTSNVVMAAEAKEAAAKAGASTTNHNFEDLLVQGKYHFSDEAVTTVEADKVFDSLIGVRTDFKDRLEESATKQ